MIERDQGHMFELAQLDEGEDDAPVRLRYVKRMGEGYLGNRTSYGGTTSQEVMRTLIARAKYLNWQIPSWRTRLSIWLLRTCIWLYEDRAARRHGMRRLPLRLLRSIETWPTCPVCGHIKCHHHVTYTRHS